MELILPSCLNIETLNLGYMYKGMDAFIKIDRFKKLKKLHVSGRRASHFKEVTLLIIRTMKMLLTPS